jgi:hypothetical protein
LFLFSRKFRENISFCEHLNEFLIFIASLGIQINQVLFALHLNVKMTQLSELDLHGDIHTSKNNFIFVVLLLSLCAIFLPVLENLGHFLNTARDNKVAFREFWESFTRIMTEIGSTVWWWWRVNGAQANQAERADRAFLFTVFILPHVFLIAAVLIFGSVVVSFGVFTCLVASLCNSELCFALYGGSPQFQYLAFVTGIVPLFAFTVDFHIDFIVDIWRHCE